MSLRRVFPSVEGAVRAAVPLDHQVLAYRGREAFLRAAVPFLNDALQQQGFAVAAVDDVKANRLRAVLGRSARDAAFTPPEAWYTTPVRAVGSLHDALVDARDRGRRLWFLGEPVRDRRDSADVEDWIRLEHVVHELFAGQEAHLLCAYDVRSLPRRLLRQLQADQGTTTQRGWLRRTRGAPRGGGWLDAPLPALPIRTARIELRPGDLAAVRGESERAARRAGFDGERVANVMVAANELATNALVHARPPRTARIRHGTGTVTVQVEDAGPGLVDPLVGWLAPSRGEVGGWGLWLARQLADRVQLRTGPAGTVVRATFRERDPSSGRDQNMPG